MHLYVNKRKNSSIIFVPKEHIIIRIALHPARLVTISVYHNEQIYLFTVFRQLSWALGCPTATSVGGCVYLNMSVCVTKTWLLSKVTASCWMYVRLLVSSNKSTVELLSEDTPHPSIMDTY